MKKVFLLPCILLVAMAAQAQPGKAKPAAKTPAKTPAKTTATKFVVNPLKNNSDSLSYAFGISLGEYLKSQGIKSINFAIMNKAIDNTLKNQPCLFDANVANQIMSKVAEEKSQKGVSVEKEAANKYLAENKKKAGVKVTASGLQYEVLVQGNGAIPKLSDTVIAHYSGRLTSGKEFDNSYKRGEPLTIPVGGVIAGWTEALQLMPVGSKWKLTIPSALGYGDYGAGNDIPGGAALVFDIELVGIAGQNK